MGYQLFQNVIFNFKVSENYLFDGVKNLSNHKQIQFEDVVVVK